MKSLAIILTCILLVLTVPGVFAQQREVETGGQRLAQTGMKFLSISVDSRAAALGDAVTAQEWASSAMFYNPAGMARFNGTAHAAVGQVQWVANYMYNHASAAFRPAGGRYGVIGLTVISAEYGNFIGTIRADNERGFIETESVSPSALSVGLGYARALTDRFSVGGNAKFVRQSLGSSIMGFNDSGAQVVQENEVSTVAFDFGVLYKTGFRSLNFALSARNFSRELTYAEENFELPLTFSIGVAMDMVDFTSYSVDNHSFLLAVDAQRPRDYAEQIRIGGEYLFMNTLALRAGYVFPTDEQGINLGAGLQTGLGGIRFGFDYTYTNFGILGNVNRIGIDAAF